ncbi:LacI family DNA-binding transcriptional regulator [Terriglobus tenax]|uniref:LacI family DNA-binding transcriptional regulator n=1 Tax=Terriglobus tenax TaxID=1111115 RepID=UPI0021DF67D2|nr:LacI family DNA-binding transcriptional regulator [Terriglobus tenax]
MAIRLQDIADDLKLSKMTISKVLRGQTDVSAETKARVLKRVQELNYRPNISARGLRTGQTFTLGLALPSLLDPAMPQIVAGVNEAVRTDGYSVVITSADDDAEQEEREVELHLSRQVDALLLCLRNDATELPAVLATASVPVVLVGPAPARFSGTSVSMRESEVGQMAAQHLLERRCRRIAYLRGPRTPVADMRFTGFLEQMREAGIPVKQEWVIEAQPGDAGYRNGYEAMQRLLAAKTVPDGVMTYADLQAMGVRDAALAAGLEIPRQLRVIGCGNALPMCETGLTLSSMDLAYRELGKRAAKTALRSIGEKGSAAAARPIFLSPRVVQRDSTKEWSAAERKRTK